jgi:hypothetical protein
MTSIQAELSDSLYRSVRELAEQEGIPLERLAGLAVAQAVGAWMSQRNLVRERAERGDRKKFLSALGKSPDVPPQAGDELPK